MVDEFAKLFRENHPVEGKRIDNLVLFLCQLYNFKVSEVFIENYSPRIEFLDESFFFRYSTLVSCTTY